MKRVGAVAPKPQELVQKRALIRGLIEQNGWASTPDRPASPQVAESVRAEDNVIPFPIELVRH
jgi:hypothetical protein